MDHHAAFLEDIIAHPEDDAPRLIYADWLEEHGGQPERAEFIRVQCQLKKAIIRNPPGSEFSSSIRADDMASYPELLRRERELLYNLVTGEDFTYHWLWSRGFEVAENLTFRRGFVESLSIPGSDWLTYGDDLVKRAPLRLVRLTSWSYGENQRWFLDQFHRAEQGEPCDFSDRWPGIKFELPSANTFDLESWSGATTEDFRRFVDRPAFFP